ncbi:MAG: TIGR02452 family protein [Lachnospiraceae bacterium]|nr:TIGR02452 family protein [Lachnospiraceae bacterium]
MRKRQMGRQENVGIFQNTERLCKTNVKLAESVKYSTEHQKLILETDHLKEQKKNLYDKRAKVIVSKKRTFQAAAAYQGTKTAVHNFASAANPGGGVVKGASAQEECLCRCSGLYFNLNVQSMWKGFYTPHRNAHDAIHNDDIIFTPDVVVFKSDTSEPKLLPEEEWYQVDVITCAAPNLRRKPSNAMNPSDGDAVVISDKDLLAVHEKRLRRILETAVSEGVESIILGAFGCGAFRNNPEIVAKAAENVLGEYLYAFKNVEFAVYCRPEDERNYKVFERVLKKLGNGE